MYVVNRSSYPDHGKQAEGAEGGAEPMEDDGREEVTPDLLDDENYQLVLPSGEPPAHYYLLTNEN